MENFRRAGLAVVIIVALVLSLFPVAPVGTVMNSPAGMPFAPNMYKVATELKSVEKGDVSTYYQVNTAPWRANGYNALLFGFCRDCKTTTPTGYTVPVNGDFNNRLSYEWIVQNTSAITGGTFIDQASRSLVYQGNASLHSYASVPGPDYGWGGVMQNLTDHFWHAPLVSNLNFTGQFYPVRLDSSPIGPDALVVLRFDLSYWDTPVTPTRILFVFQNTTSLVQQSLPYSNDTQTVVYPRSVSSNQWNGLSWNLTDIAINSFGFWRGIDMRVNSMAIQSWSRNGAVSEFYIDSLRIQSMKSSQASHNTQVEILSHLNETSYPSGLLLVSGVTDMAYPTDLLWFDTKAYPNDGGYDFETFPGIDFVQTAGGYAFMSNPPSGSTTFYNGTAIPAFSTGSQWQMDVWDSYLQNGYYVMGYVEQHAYLRRTADFSATRGPAQFVYTNSLSGPEIVEAMAQGRSFGEYVWLKQPMGVYLTGQNDTVPMGRFPIYVDTSTNTVTLHIRLTGLYGLGLTVNLYRNGALLQQTPVPSGLTTFDQYVPVQIPDSVDYFRFEVSAKGTPHLAFSNPLIYIHTPSLNGVWLAETPGLDYGAGRSSLSNISQDGTKVQFTVNDPMGVNITTQVHYPFIPGTVHNATSWSYDQTNQLLSIGTFGTQTVTVEGQTSMVFGGGGGMHYVMVLTLLGTSEKPRQPRP